MRKILLGVGLAFTLALAAGPAAMAGSPDVDINIGVPGVGIYGNNYDEDYDYQLRRGTLAGPQPRVLPCTDDRLRPACPQVLRIPSRQAVAGDGQRLQRQHIAAAVLSRITSKTGRQAFRTATTALETSRHAFYRAEGHSI